MMVSWVRPKSQKQLDFQAFNSKIRGQKIQGTEKSQAETIHPPQGKMTPNTVGHENKNES
jgi:hypothetical protein